MATTYSFRNMVLGEVAGVCNEMAEDDYCVDEMYKEGNRMYILYSKWGADEDEVELSELDQVYVAMDALSIEVSGIKKALALLGSGVEEPSE